MRQNVDTVIEKTKTSQPRAIPVLKEHFQAIGLLLEKTIIKEEMFQYPLLNLVNPDGSLTYFWPMFPFYTP